MRRRLIVAAAVVIVLCLVGLSVWRRVAARHADAGAPIPVPVVAVVPTRGAIERTLEYAGTLEPRATVTVTPKSSGRIERILAAEGEAVRRGELLVQMEDDVARLQSEQASAALRAAQAQLETAQRGVRPEELANAKASLSQAEADLAAAADGWSRAQRLYKEGTIAKSSYEEADRSYRAAQTALENGRRTVAMMEQGAGTEEQRAAQAQVTAAQAQADLAALALEDTRVTAPIAGTVVRIPADEGNLAGPATPLAVIVSESAMVVKVPVPERYYTLFRSGQGRIGARVRFAALPDRGPRAGRLIAISPTIDPASRTFTAEVEVADPRRELAAGMYATVTFVVERAEDAVLVPAAAIASRGGRTGLFTVEGTPPAARFREVAVGIDDGSTVEIAAGLDGGERVVVEGNAFLEDGQPVSPGD